MSAFKPTDVFLCLGRRGCGKSHLAKGLQRTFPRRVVFDTLGEYSAKDGTLCRSFDDFGRAIERTEHAHKFSIVYQFSVETREHALEFDHAMRVLFYRGNVLAVVEEVQEFATPHQLPQWLRTSLLRGRHRGLGMLFTTQRPGECNKTLLSQANHVFCGSLHEKNDVDYVRAVLGEAAQQLGSLPERQFLYFQPGKPVSRVSNDL